MTYGTVLGVVAIHLALMLTMMAYFLTARALCPQLVDWAEQRQTQAPVRMFFTGVAVGVPSFIAGVALTKNPGVPGLLPTGSLILLLLILGGLCGGAGLAQRLGRGLGREIDGREPWRPVLRGGAVLVTLFIAPVLGWIVMLPWALLTGLGCVVSYLVRGRRVMARQVAAPSPPDFTQDDAPTVS